MKGCYLSAHSLSSGLRYLYDPDGNIVKTTGTKTYGIQEGINEALENGYAFKALSGGGDVTLGAGLLIPSAAGMDIDLGAVNFILPAGVAGPFLSFNSMNGGSFSHSGRVTLKGGGNCAYSFAPKTPAADQIIIQNHSIRLGWLVVSGTNVTYGAQLDPTHGSIINGSIDFGVIQGWDGIGNRLGDGIYLLTSPSGLIGINENTFTVKQMIGFSAVGIQIGSDQPGDRFIGDNEWNININPTANNWTAVNTYASYDCWRGAVTIYTGSCTHSICFNGTANYNKYQLRQDTTNANVWNFSNLSNIAF